MAGCFGCNGCFSGLRTESKRGHAGKRAQVQGTYTKETCPEEPRCKVAHVEVQPDEAEAILLEVEEWERHRLATEAEALQPRKSEETLKSAIDVEHEALREMQEAVALLQELEKDDLDKPMVARVEAGFEEVPTLAEEDDNKKQELKADEKKDQEEAEEEAVEALRPSSNRRQVRHNIHAPWFLNRSRLQSRPTGLFIFAWERMACE